MIGIAFYYFYFYSYYNTHSNDNDNDNNKSLSLLEDLLDSACRLPNNTCHSAVFAQGRTLKVKHEIEANTVLLEIARPGHMSDTDAMQDEWIQKHFFNCHHIKTVATNSNQQSPYILETEPEPVQSRAYLAVLLIRMLKGQHKVHDPVVKKWLEYLPTIPEMQQHHPVLQDSSELQSTLGSHSAAYYWIGQKQDLVHAEYQALTAQYPDFANQVSRNEYTYARCLGMSRALSTPPTVNMQASLALVIDAMNHDAKQENVGYVYNPVTDKFVAIAKTNIAAGSELLLSYGQRLYPSRLFASYGFVPPQQESSSLLGGSGGVNLAVFHKVHSSMPWATPPPQQQGNHLVHYLTYDVGHESCLQAPSGDDNNMIHPTSLLKYYQFIFLEWAGSIADFWIFPVHNGHDVPDALYWTMSLCRFLTMTPNDEQGAVERVGLQLSNMYTSNLAYESFLFLGAQDATNPAWEYRAIFLLQQLARTAVEQFGSTVQQEEAQIKASVPHSTAWNVAMVRRSELSSLQVVLDYAQSRLDKLSKFKPATGLRQEPCPLEHSLWVVEWAKNGLHLPFTV